jgi:hypothetical protein
MAAGIPDTSDREQRFRELIVHAVDLGGLNDHLLAISGNNVALDRDDMPAALLTEMMHLTRLQFEALCHDLTDAWLAHAAPTHMRPVLEGMAQIGFILGHETDNPVGKSEQRATCLALARARETHRAMVTANPGSVPPGNIEEGRLKVTFFEELHARVGCPFPEDSRDWPCREADGKPCKHREAWPCRRVLKAAPRLLSSPTLLRLSSRMSFPFTDLEQASSLVLHQSLIDRMMGDTGRGTNAFRNATYKERALALAMALSAYGGSLGWVMETIDMPAAGVLGRYVSDIWKRPDLAAIMADEWDKADG